MSSVYDKIRDWANEKGLFDPENVDKQIRKFNEEWGELNGAITRGDDAKIIDGFGDCIVVLTILASQLGWEIEDCVDEAWHEIKDRKGETIDGVFYKEGG